MVVIRRTIKMSKDTVKALIVFSILFFNMVIVILVVRYFSAKYKSNYHVYDLILLSTFISYFIGAISCAIVIKLCNLVGK